MAEEYNALHQPQACSSVAEGVQPPPSGVISVELALEYINYLSSLSNDPFLPSNDLGEGLGDVFLQGEEYKIDASSVPSQIHNYLSPSAFAHPPNETEVVYPSTSSHPVQQQEHAVPQNPQQQHTSYDQYDRGYSVPSYDASLGIPSYLSSINYTVDGSTIHIAGPPTPRPPRVASSKKSSTSLFSSIVNNGHNPFSSIFARVSPRHNTEHKSCPSKGDNYEELPPLTSQPPPLTRNDSADTVLLSDTPSDTTGSSSSSTPSVLSPVTSSTSSSELPSLFSYVPIKPRRAPPTRKPKREGPPTEVGRIPCDDPHCTSTFGAVYEKTRHMRAFHQLPEAVSFLSLAPHEQGNLLFLEKKCPHLHAEVQRERNGDVREFKGLAQEIVAGARCNICGSTIRRMDMIRRHQQSAKCRKMAQTLGRGAGNAPS